MALSVEECSPEEWMLHAQKIKSSSISDRLTLEQNLFGSLQFIGDELQRAQYKAYRLLSDHIPTSWCLVYFLSPKVIRIRGLYTEQGFRGQGHMKELLLKVLEKYKGHAEKVLSFSTPGAFDFHRKFGFEIESDFVPRPVEHYDPVTKLYSCDEKEVLTLFYKKLT